MSRRRTPLWIKLITLIEVLFLSCIVSVTFYLSSIIQTPKTLHLQEGSFESIITQLHKKGFEITPIERKIFHYIGRPKAGWIALGKSQMSRLDFLYALSSGKWHIHKITLIPGETLQLFTQQLSKQLSLDAQKLQDIYHQLSPYPEGGIYADTYHVPEGIAEKHLMAFLVRSSERRFKAIAKKNHLSYNPKMWLPILTKASIVQKEAASIKEMPLVASVIENRLEKKMRLQMDGTLNYGAFSHIKVTPKRIREDNSTFNTYKHKGLPNSPICAVNHYAIEAVLHPAKTPYLYFMKNRQGVHDFSKTFQKHRKFIRALE